MNGLNLSNRIDHWAMALVITLAVVTQIGAVSAMIDLAHAL